MFPPPNRSQSRPWSQIQGEFLVSKGRHFHELNLEGGGGMNGGGASRGRSPQGELLAGKAGQRPSCDGAVVFSPTQVQFIPMEHSVPYLELSLRSADGANAKWC
ncbi:unnamed protein product [Pipistrellus nathusii]|uniref:Uncharacterized protein n=1 Tax=Pipistrellus nathusii TaxID=59473 RepID=A0ABP0A0T0_PIPNA